MHSTDYILEILTYIDNAIIILIVLSHCIVEPQVTTVGVNQESKIRSILTIVTDDAVLNDIIFWSVLICRHYSDSAWLIGVQRVQDLLWQ